MDGQVNAEEPPNLYCCKLYLKLASYGIFFVYTAVGVDRVYDRFRDYGSEESCIHCGQFGVQSSDLLLWGIFDAFLFIFFPLTALVAVIHGDLEWLFPEYARRVLFPSFLLIAPIFVTIVAYVMYWITEFVVSIQLLASETFTTETWKQTIWASGMFLANIYAFLMTLVIMQMTYYQHQLVLEERVFLVGRAALGEAQMQNRGDMEVEDIQVQAIDV